VNLLPLVRYEMLRVARLPGSFRLRFGAATMAAGIAYIVLGTTALWNPSRAASGMFYLLVGIAGAYALLSGAIHTADCIVSEKRGRTLGLLMLTELGPVDIVLGKLAPNALQALMTLIAMFPVMAVPIAIGGVTFAEFGRVVSALLLVQATSLMAGVLASVLARELRVAMTASLGGMVLLSGVPWVIASLSRGSFPAFATVAESFSPASHVFRALARYHDPVIFSAQRFDLLLLTAGSLIAACASLVRAVRSEVPDSNSKVQGGGRMRYLAGWRHVHFSKWLEANPVLWLQRVYDPMPSSWRWGFAISLAVAMLLLLVATGTAAQSRLALAISVGIVVVLHVGVKLVSALGAARAMGRARAEGLLEELLVAGVKPSVVVSGYVGALFGEARPLLVALTVANALIIATVASMRPVGGWVDIAFVLGSCGAVLLWLDHRAAVMSAMRYSLREADPMKAFRKVLLRVLLPGWLLMLPMVVLVAVERSPRMGAAATVLAFHPLLILTLWQHRRARLDLDMGFRALSAGLEFDTDEWELREDFRRNLEWTGA
jgi:uncharacterized membrane protein/uncharacterized membrane protein YuzA (DUF378 family)